MREVTIYRHEDGKARMIPWSDRDNPLKQEINPPGATLLMYTTMPHDWIEWVKTKTEDQVNSILSYYIP